MDNYDSPVYINIQSGGMNYITGTLSSIANVAKTAYQAYNFSGCSGRDINNYLQLSPDEIPVQTFYDYFIRQPRVTINEQRIQLISKQINESLANLYDLNLHIHRYLGDKTKLIDVPRELDFSNDDFGYKSYTMLCNLYINYSSYIQSTNEINKFLCQISLGSNYSLNIEKGNREAGIEATYLECKNDQLIESLKKLRLGQSIDENITHFINTNSEYIMILNGEIPDLVSSTSFDIYNYLISVANQFKEKFENLDNGSTILDEYIDSINKYYLTLCKSISGCETKLFGLFYTKLYSSNFKELLETNNTKVITKNFPHLIKIINRANSGQNKFFTLYNYITNFNNNPENQKTQIDKLVKIEKVYESLLIYNDKIPKEEFFSLLFANENDSIEIFFNDILTQIFEHTGLSIKNLNLLAQEIELEENKLFFSKELIELRYSKYLENFDIKEPELKTSYLNPNYEIFPNIKHKYPIFIKNLIKLIAPDLNTNLKKFISYVNAFRSATSLIDQVILRDLFFKLYIQVITDTEQEQINQFVLYNKSLNNRLLQNQIDDYTTITYVKLEQILRSTELSYLNSFNNPEYEIIKTKEEFTYNSIPKNLLNKCVVDKILNKDKISGIKLLIHIVDCEKNKKSESRNKLIYFYLTLNTQEINSSRLISWKKLNTILSALSSGICTAKQIDILIQVIELKKIVDPFLRTELNLLKINQDILTQKSIYYLLSALAPEKINWNIIGLLKEYATENLMPELLNGIKLSLFDYAKSFIFKPNTTKVAKKATKEILSVSEFKKHVFEKINVENFFDVKLNSSNPQYKFTCFKIYSYFNFDAVIVSMKTIQKIVLQFEENKFNKKIFNTLKKIIIRNFENLRQINKSSSDKLNYFVKNKWNRLEKDSYYISQLYDILKEVADENLFPVNLLDFLKEKGIDVIIDDEVKDNTIDNLLQNDLTLRDLYLLPSQKETDYQISVVEKQVLPIYKMFETFIDEKILEEKKEILISLDNMKHGICEDYSDCSMNTIIQLINKSGPFIKSNDQIRKFFATGKHLNSDYASEQELYSILESLSKSSALIKNITTEVTQVATDSITSAVNSKLQSVALDMGFTEVPVDAIAKVKEIAQTAKTIAITAGIGFATVRAYHAVDKLFGSLSNSNSNSNSLAAYEETDFKSRLKFFIGSVGIGLTLNTARNLFPSINSLVKEYIEYKSTELGLPMPLISTTIIGSIIMSGLTQFLSSGVQEAGVGENKSLIERILDWIFNSIDKLYGFNGKKPESASEPDPVHSNKNVESIYTYLTSQKLGSDDIFDSAVLNEHPDQNAILNELRSKYQEFNSISTLDSNLYVKLTKHDKKKIKKIIGRIVGLELNLFKGNQPYTFVNAISKFLNE